METLIQTIPQQELSSISSTPYTWLFGDVLPNEENKLIVHLLSNGATAYETRDPNLIVKYLFETYKSKHMPLSFCSKYRDMFGSYWDDETINNNQHKIFVSLNVRSLTNKMISVFGVRDKENFVMNIGFEFDKDYIEYYIQYRFLCVHEKWNSLLADTEVIVYDSDLDDGSGKHKSGCILTIDKSRYDKMIKSRYGKVIKDCHSFYIEIEQDFLDILMLIYEDRSVVKDKLLTIDMDDMCAVASNYFKNHLHLAIDFTNIE